MRIHTIAIAGNLNKRKRNYVTSVEEGHISIVSGPKSIQRGILNVLSVFLSTVCLTVQLIKFSFWGIFLVGLKKTLAIRLISTSIRLDPRSSWWN